MQSDRALAHLRQPPCPSLLLLLQNQRQRTHRLLRLHLQRPLQLMLLLRHSGIPGPLLGLDGPPLRLRRAVKSRSLLHASLDSRDDMTAGHSSSHVKIKVVRCPQLLSKSTTSLTCLYMITLPERCNIWQSGTDPKLSCICTLYKSVLGFENV